MNKNLLRALSAFMEDLWLPFEDSLGSINLEISNGMINKDGLVQEYEAAVSNENFDWLGLAHQSQLLINPEAYTNIEISNYVQWLLQDYLFPEKALNENQKKQLVEDVSKVLKSYTDNQGWMFSYDLYDTLKMNEKYYDLRYYNLSNINYQTHGIECNHIENKDREIGYLRYNES